MGHPGIRELIGNEIRVEGTPKGTFEEAFLDCEAKLRGSKGTALLRLTAIRADNETEFKYIQSNLNFKGKVHTLSTWHPQANTLLAIWQRLSCRRF